MTSTKIFKTAGAAAALSLVLAGCGGGASGAPTDASVEEFCTAYTEGFGDAIAAVDPEASEDEQAEAVIDALKEFAEKMEEVGTPEDMSDEAREGFELSLDSISDLSADDLQDEDAMKKLEEELSGDDKAAAEALQAYVTDSCDLGVPTE